MLTAERTETETGYTITYTKNGAPIFATDKEYASVCRTVENGYVTEERYFDENGLPVSVSGYHIMRSTYDGDRPVRAAYYDADGKPVRNASGYAIVEYTADEANHIVLEMHRDEKDEPIKLTSGAYGMRRDEFDAKGRTIRYTFVGIDGSPISISSGYSSVLRTYGDTGQVTTEMFLGTDGRPALRDLGNSGRAYIRDEQGKRMGIIYLDADGAPMMNNRRYGIVRYDYDEWGNITRNRYCDLDGNPVVLRRGQAAQMMEYQQGKKIRSYFVDAQGNELFLLDEYLKSNPAIVAAAAILLTAAALLLPRRGRWILLILYVLFIGYMTLFVREAGRPRYNLELFWSYRQILQNASIRKFVIDNILLFVPLGALLFTVAPRFLPAAALLSILIEITQYIGGFGLFELDDILGNTAGSVIGWLVMKGIMAFWSRRCFGGGFSGDVMSGRTEKTA